MLLKMFDSLYYDDELSDVLSQHRVEEWLSRKELEESRSSEGQARQLLDLSGQRHVDKRLSSKLEIHDVRTSSAGFLLKGLLSRTYDFGVSRWCRSLSVRRDTVGYVERS